MGSANNGERLQAELELLVAMYPDEFSYQEHLQEVMYSDDHGKLTLRLSASYPSDARPEVIDASSKGAHKTDLRSRMKRAVEDLPDAEEALDAIIAQFLEVITELEAKSADTAEPSDNMQADTLVDGTSQKQRTTIVWLHHLLNTSKRKQALAPSDVNLSGISKPGYPGVLIYSGPATNVDEHVNGLKQLNWAAFQVRLEDDNAWSFAHGKGVTEVESMKDVVTDIDPAKKDMFLEAMRMK